MQTRLQFADTPKTPINRSALYAVPHRLLLFVANNSEALKNPALLDAARRVSGTNINFSGDENNQTSVITNDAMATLLKVPATPLPPATTAAVPASTEEDAANTNNNASSSTSLQQQPQYHQPSAATAMYVYRDTTFRTILETVFESDPIAFLESLLSLADNGNTSSSSSVSSDLLANVSLENIVRYAYQVILPAAIAQEKTGNVAPPSSHSHNGRATKARRTENGAADDHVMDAAEDDTNDNNNGNAAASASPTACLADCSYRPNHPCFLFHHALEDYEAAEKLAQSVAPIRRNRAIIDAISTLALNVNGPDPSISSPSSSTRGGGKGKHYHHVVNTPGAVRPVVAKDYVLAKEAMAKAGFEGVAQTTATTTTTTTTTAAAAAEEDNAAAAATSTDDADVAAATAEENKGENTTEETIAAATATATNADRPLLPIEAYLSRVSATTSKAKAVHAVFTNAMSTFKIIAPLLEYVRFSHVFPSADRVAIASPITIPMTSAAANAQNSNNNNATASLLSFIPPVQYRLSTYNVPKHGTDEDGVMLALGALLTGRFGSFIDGNQLFHNRGSSNNNHARGHVSLASHTGATLSDLMVPAIDFHFGDALMISLK